MRRKPETHGPHLGGSLRHVWDEVRVQVQGEETALWDVCQDSVQETTEQVLKGWPEVHYLPPGFARMRVKSGCTTRGCWRPAFQSRDVINLLEQEVYNRAANVTSKRVDQFNEREHG